MPTLRVSATGRGFAFDIIDGAPDYDTRHSATAVYVHYDNLIEEACLGTYANDPRPFGPTLRHKINISEHIIKHFNLAEGLKLPCDFVIQQGGLHHFIVKPSKSN